MSGIPQNVPAVIKVGIFHAEHFGAGFGIDQGHLFVRKGPVPLIKFLHRVFENIEVALGLAGVRLEHQRVELNRPHRGLEDAVGGLKIWRRGPGEIVDIFPMEAECLGAVGLGLLAGRDAAGADDIALGNVQRDIEGAEVGEELGGGVILMAIPGALRCRCSSSRRPLP